MGIKTVQAIEVSCQHCPATILVENWRFAAEFGWCVPTDGHLQLCPRCLQAHKQRVIEAASKPATDAMKTVEATCLDCGLPYAAFGVDFTFPDYQWKLIHPAVDGLLCATCIAKRAAEMVRHVANMRLDAARWRWYRRNLVHESAIRMRMMPSDSVLLAEIERE